VLHTIVREHLETFLEEARERDGDGYPAFVEREFRRYLDCGLLPRGFVLTDCAWFSGFTTDRSSHAPTPSAAGLEARSLAGGQEHPVWSVDQALSHD
jgi:hypothetical protein